MRYPSQSNTASLAILEDDARASMPFFKSPFRVLEYEAILQTFPNATIYSTRLAERPVECSAQFEEFARARSVFAGRVRPINLGADGPPPAQLAYVVFLSNAFAFSDLLEKHRIPFCLELYPGGSFALDQRANDLMLERVTKHPYFQAVIATQPITRDYLVRRGFCRPSQICYVYGGPFFDTIQVGRRKRFGFEKPAPDVCFVAHRYMPLGQDKGYDLFIESARRLTVDFPTARFHVVGDFDSNTLPLPAELSERLTFYGTQLSSFFPDFYARMDAIVSPNRAFLLRPGAFDGFPTGCCVEAALQGTTVICSDPLGLNQDFRDGEDLALVEPDAAHITACLSGLLADPERLCQLGESGQAIFQRLFKPEAQIAPRLRLLEHYLSPGVFTKLSQRCSRIFRTGAVECVYNQTEVIARLKQTGPDLAVRQLHPYDLVSKGCDCGFLLVCPTPGWDNQTEAIFDLRPLRGVPVWRGEFSVTAALPFPGVDHLPMELEVAGLDEPVGTVICERKLTLAPKFEPLTIVLEHPRQPIRYLRFRLRMAAGATTNLNAVVLISQVITTTRRAAA